ncbi:hypothetical protein [Gordonia sp. OPL2]|uniref:hypothetical protein n=1 Tax=Gordonia sp. OPL2 TaxID=2486274 RepID=UPI0016552632|nr:hypothetical protein [Gordonia sp. OPL2]ROZ99262.1 hypothetical protein EEB19_12735 [Gordonia sp. OPL2]
MTSMTPRHLADHGDRHPMSIVAYMLVLFIIPSLGLAVTFLAQGQGPAAIAAAVAGALSLVGAAVIYSTMARRLDHSPLIPDSSSAEKARYLVEYRH